MSGNTNARARVARSENEEWVLARGAIAGERAISFGRLALLLLVTASQLIVRAMGEAAAKQDVIRVVLITLYAGFAIAGYVYFGRVKPSQVLKARRLTLIFAPLIDFSFAVAMNVRLYQLTGESAAARLAPFLAVLLAASILRSSRRHIIYVTTLAVASYTGYVLYAGSYGVYLVRDTLFVAGALGGEGLFLVYATSMIRRMLLEFGEVENISRFLPAQVARRVRQEGAQSLAPSTREATVLFSDIRNFTSMSERMPPTEVMAFLTDYFERMQRVVNGHDGVVNKYLGDGLLAVWGIPDVDKDHARKAMSAALDMRRVVAELNAERTRRGLPEIHIGIGLHSGPLAAGMLGGEAQHEYTVIGDAVNLTSRIEGLTKALGADILVSDATWALAGAMFKGRVLGAQQVKGREQSIVVHALDGTGN